MSINTRYAVVTVVKEEHYLVPMVKGHLTNINDNDFTKSKTDLSVLLERWFKYPQFAYAERDNYRIKAEDKVLRIYATLPEGHQIYHLKPDPTDEEEQGMRVMFDALKRYFEEKTMDELKKRFPGGEN